MSLNKPTSEATLTWRGHYTGSILTDGLRNIGSISLVSRDYEAELFIPGYPERQGRWEQWLGHFSTAAEAKSALMRAHAERMQHPANYDRTAWDADAAFRNRAA